jgi:hypothetical protein
VRIAAPPIAGYHLAAAHTLPASEGQMRFARSGQGGRHGISAFYKDGIVLNC